MVTRAEGTVVQEREVEIKPSWIDSLVGWIDDLPIPAWVFYVAVTLALTALINVVLWLDGSVPFGTYGAFPGLFPPFVFYFLALYHYLTRVGSRSLHVFWPLLDTDEPELAQIDHELATLPRRWGWIALALALLSSPNYLIGNPSLAFADLVPNTFLPYILAFLVALFFGATFSAVSVRSFRQIQTIRRLHIRAANINILKLAPVHAFSALTARTAIGFFIIVVLGALYNFSSFGGTAPATFTTYILAYIMMVTLAVIVFILPVLGLRDRLQEEKGQSLDRINQLLQTTEDRFHSKVDTADYTDLKGMENAIDMLIRERERIGKISTWPWDPATFRAFGSTLLLPIILRILTQLVGNFF
jgi:hypothetical protein